MRILFLTTNPASTVASTRYRISQYLPGLQAAGHEVVVSTFYPEAGSRRRDVRVLQGIGTRVRDLLGAASFDVAMIHREILPYGWNHAAREFARRVPLVFDFDDAVFLAEASRLRPSNYASTRLLVDASERVFAGNEFLASYARRSHSNVTILPTVVDTDAYRPLPRDPGRVPVIGWIGSRSTSPYLEPLLPVLDDLGRSHPFVLRVVGAARPPRLRHVEIETPQWTADAEVELFRDLDVGLYPLPNDIWVLGKCGFKAIQYMACGVPSVVSPYGVVRDIVRHGVDGFWAQRPEDYRDALAALLASPDLRRRMGDAGRERAVASYSLRATTPAFHEGLAVAAERRRCA